MATGALGLGSETPGGYHRKGGGARATFGILLALPMTR
jgi:hypothetical protein